MLRGMNILLLNEHDCGDGNRYGSGAGFESVCMCVVSRPGVREGIDSVSAVVNCALSVAGFDRSAC